MKRVFCTVGGGFMGGAFCASFFGFSGQVLLAAACFLIFLFCVLLLRKHPAYPVFWICFCVGIILFCAKDTWYYQPVLQYADTDQSVTGTLISHSERSGGRHSYLLRTSKIGNDERTADIQLFTNNALEASEGDRATLRLTLRLPSSNTFDGVRYYKSRNIVLLASSPTGELTETSAPPAPSPLQQVRELNHSMARQLDNLLSPAASAVIRSMVLGDSSQMDNELAEAYIASGAYHLFSVSGLHLSLLVSAAMFLFRPLGRRWSAVLAIPLVLFYIVFSGMHLSTIRSGIMLLVLLAGQLFYYRSDPLNSLWLAGTCIILGDSYAILDIGLLLSMAATFGIVWLYPKLRRIKSPFALLEQQPFAFLLDTIRFSIAVTIPMLPIYLFTFQRLSLVTPLANLLILPVATLTLLLGFVLCILLPFGVPPILCLAAGGLVELQNELAFFLAELPFSNLGLDYPEFRVALFFVFFLLLAGWLFRPLLWKRVTAIAAGSIATASILLAMVSPYTMSSLYAVGDGTAANLVFLYGGQCTVVSTSDDDYIDQDTMAFLRGKGISRIDNLIIAYPSLHAYQDTFLLLSGFPVEKVFYHKENLLCSSLLEEQYPDLAAIPLEQNLHLDAGYFTLQTSYQNQSMTLLASYYDTPVFIGTPAAAKSVAAALYFYKSANQETKDFPPGITWLLRRPYEETPVPPAYDRILHFRFHPDGKVVSSRE